MGVHIRLGNPLPGVLVLDSWAGRSRQRVLIVGQTERSWEIAAIGRTRLAGRRRWIEPGEIARVPLYAVRLVEATGGP